jgi:heme/copper-type cytochrome/quinol oxidase subunit 3
MKIISIILLVLFAITATAQDNAPKDQRTAGDELKLASKTFYIGTGLLLAGVLVVVATANLEYADTDTDLTGWYIGAGIAAVGLIFVAVSASHYKKAGVKLNKSEKHALNIKTSRDGVTLAMKF